jgi:hypothetical protein
VKMRLSNKFWASQSAGHRRNVVEGATAHRPGVLSGDPDQEYSVDVTTDELTTGSHRNACSRARTEIFLSGVPIRTLPTNKYSHLEKKLASPIQAAFAFCTFQESWRSPLKLTTQPTTNIQRCHVIQNRLFTQNISLPFGRLYSS